MLSSNLSLENTKPGRRLRLTRKTLFWLAIAVFGLGGSAAIVVPNFVKQGRSSCANTVINNLKQIDGAKEQFVLEKRAREAVNVSEKGVQAISP